MREFWKSFVKFFVSLELTVWLLALSMVLVFFATLDQVQLGIWGIQEKWFRSFIVLHDVRGFPVPVFPGGYFLGGLLFINLVVSHVYRFKFSWKKSGIILTHLGLIVLLVGELLTGLWQEDYQLRLDEGQTRNYSESPRLAELAIVDGTDPEWDDVVAVPEELLEHGGSVQHAKLPFRVEVKAYYPNAVLQRRGESPNQPPAPATRDIGAQLALIPLPITYKPDERNLSAAILELVGPEGSLGTWLVSTMLIDEQKFDYAGKTWRLGLRFERKYKPYSLTLMDFSHDRYAGTDIPKNFSSRIRLQSAETKTDREVLIYMNNPLRYEGMTFYQAGFDNNDKTTVLQVVRNPSWLLPYVACALLFVGLMVQFCIHLIGFLTKRRPTAS